jgi:tetratricopeptide (TPR) repeat protein
MTIFLSIFKRFLKLSFGLLFLILISCATASPSLSLYNEALSAQNAGNFSQAIFLYEESLKKSPRFYKSRYNLTLLLIQTKEWQEAHENLALLEKDLKGNVQVEKLKAFLFFSEGKTQLAYDLYRDLGEKLPTDMEILYNLSYLNDKLMNNPRESIRLIEKMRALDPRFKGLEADWVKTLEKRFSE